MNLNDVDHIVLCITNYSELYPRHLELARENANEAKWLVHVLTRALPQYRREMRTTREISLGTSNNVAKRLRKYYMQHISEF